MGRWWGQGHGETPVIKGLIPAPSHAILGGARGTGAAHVARLGGSEKGLAAQVGWDQHRPLRR